MFAAISVVLGYFTLVLGDYLKIGFSTIANQFVYYLFGPVAGGLFGGALDILKYIIRPTGAFFPGFTISAMVGGVLYGCFLYKRPISFWRVLAAELTVSIICNMLLGTLWLSMLYGKAFMALLPMRVFKNIMMWPVNSRSVLYHRKALSKHLEVFRPALKPWDGNGLHYKNLKNNQ